MKRVINIFLFIIFFFLNFCASAHELKISNFSDHLLSFSVNDKCVSEIGTLDEKNGKKTIDEALLNKLCLNFSIPCEIVAYKGKECREKRAGGLLYLTKRDFIVFSDAADITIYGTESKLDFKNTKDCLQKRAESS